MGKNDFDIDFDFEEEYGFDPKSFLDDEAYDDKMDLDAFSDEELGLTGQPEEKKEPEQAPADADAGSEFDLDDDFDLSEFLNMGEEENAQEEAQPEQWDDDVPDFFDRERPSYPEEPEYAPEEESLPEEEAYEGEEAPAEYAEEGYEEEDEEAEEAEDADEDEQPRKRRAKKPIRLPKITLPKLKTPNIFTKFFDLYFAPVLHKELREEPQDPANPRRRRRKSRQQIFKEVYLPPILVCVCLILVLSFLIGSVSNVIEQKRINNQTQQSQLEASQSAKELEELQNQSILAQAEKLAAGYDYQGAQDLLDTINGGDLSGYPEIAAKRTEYATAQSQLVEYKDPTMIPNLSFHVLIADLARAMADTDDLAGSYNKNFVSTEEFTKILNQLYSNGYVLVDFDSFVSANSDTEGNELFFSNSLWLPADKKPVMITETMVNYFAYMVDGDKDGEPDAKGDGFACKLVLDDNGDIRAKYVDGQGQTLVGNYDLVPILEDFIKEHPDFSYRGARAILAVTGDEGVFGYRINTSYIATKGQEYHDNEVAGAQELVNALRSKGYTLACFTYSNKAYKDMNATQIQADLQSWTQQVTQFIGNVDTFVFARTSNITDYSENGGAFKVMYQSGFRYFISNATSPYTEVTSKYIRQNRLMVTGQNMRHYSSQFTGMFDCNAVLDMTTRVEVPN